MVFEETRLKGAYLIKPAPFQDHRGFFARWYCENSFKEAGLHPVFVQANHSATLGKGSIRGLHFQFPPHAEIKLVKCIAGKIWDVIVDIRTGSPTYLQWVAAELTAENMNALYVPEGFAHGFQTLTDHAEIIYMVTGYYKKEAEGGLRYNDESIGVNWPLPVNKISDKDLALPLITRTSFKGVTL